MEPMLNANLINKEFALAILLVVGIATFVQAAPRDLAAPSSRPSVEPFAVVELFTSEGCSSCPPADRVLADIVSNARKNGQRVFPIAFHVDYWNRLGWKDRFSTALFSQRQGDYSKAFKSDSVYTPQMIVNGKREFNGSQARRAADEIAAALKAPAIAGLALEARLQNGRAVVRYSADRVPAGCGLHLVAVERGLETAVARGENSGQKLHHENVARAWKTVQIDAAASGSVEIELPADAKPGEMTVIGFVQDSMSMKIVGAAASELVIPR